MKHKQPRHPIGASTVFSRLKRVCSGLLAVAALFAACGSASAAGDLFPFQDVPTGAWYREAVVYAWYEGLFAGTSSTTFSPDTTMNRAMLVTVLYSMTGSPQPEGVSPFTDVPQGAWYQKPVTWAWQNGITSGTSPTTFGPQEPLTREQLVALLYQYARLQGYDTSGRSSLSQYTDLRTASSYAVEPFQWAVSIGIISGTSASTLSPTSGATRAQVAQILMQFCRHYGVFHRDVAVSLPVLMYHHLSQEGSGSVTIAIDLFAQHLAALENAGYNTVTIDDLLDYVYQDISLPENPVLITFDDGYLSNYEYAYPLLQEHTMYATIFVIGVSIGRDTYKDTGRSITPHFSREQAEEMEASGLIQIQSHSYDFHQVENLDTAPVRAGIVQLSGESDAAYSALVLADCQRMETLLPSAPVAFAYPYGLYSQKSEALLSQAGIQITFTTVEKTNTLLRGDPQSLRLLGRYNVDNSISAEKLLNLLEQ